MPSFHTQTRPPSALANQTNGNATVLLHCVRALLVSPHMEVRHPLLRTLQALSADVTVCSTRAQAEEALSRQAFEIVFCDEHLPDGSDCDLIHSFGRDDGIPRVVVTTRTGEWELYFEAIRKGAFDVIRSPWHATDVELAVIRASREQDRTALSRGVA